MRFFACGLVLQIALLAPTVGQQKNVPGFEDLTIVIVGLDNDKGKVDIALVNSEQGYVALMGNKEKPFRSATVEIQNRRASAVFRSVPFGEYAISVFHDENGNVGWIQGYSEYPKRPTVFRIMQEGDLVHPTGERSGSLSIPSAWPLKLR